jgi:hypothetical protein
MYDGQRPKNYSNIDTKKLPIGPISSTYTLPIHNTLAKIECGHDDEDRPYQSSLNPFILQTDASYYMEK